MGWEEQAQVSLEGPYGPSGIVERVVGPTMQLADVGTRRASVGAQDVVNWRGRGELVHHDGDLCALDEVRRWGKRVGLKGQAARIGHDSEQWVFIREM